MMSQPIVSIIIPTYNHANYLREALRSVCEQTFIDWEAIVVNNFSEDATIEVVDSFADSRICLINFQNNGVISASRNRGIEMSRGKYLAFLDSDDKWYPDKLKRCITFLNEGADVVCHGMRYIGQREGNLYCGPESKATFDALLDYGCCITTSAAVVCKDAVLSVGGFSENTEIVTAEDYDFWIKLAQVHSKIKCIPEIFGEYRVHANNQSGSVARHLQSTICVIKKFIPVDNSCDYKTRIRLSKRIGLAYYGAGRSMQKSGQYSKAWLLFLRAAIRRPLYIKTYVSLVINAYAHSMSGLFRLKNRL